MRVEHANAKINLYLDIVGRRENGYHDLVSIMQTVSLCDLVTLDCRASDKTEIRLLAKGNDEMPTDRRNLAWRAAELFLERVGIERAVTITIEKRIPMAAGLAGGSADAAAVLRGLNALCEYPLTCDELCALGARLGADIPFCIVGGSALVTGIGDRLADAASMPDCTLVIAAQGEGVSTPWGYGRLDELHGFFSTPKTDANAAEAVLQAMAAGNLRDASRGFYNIFEEIVPRERPCVDQIKETMLAGGAYFSMMSGSGPSVFGIFDTESDSERVCEALKKDGAVAFVCRPCGKYEVRM